MFNTKLKASETLEHLVSCGRIETLAPQSQEQLSEIVFERESRLRAGKRGTVVAVGNGPYKYPNGMDRTSTLMGWQYLLR